VEPDILAYYNQGRERARLESIGQLEFLRTQELLRRYLPRPPAAVLDIGGGAGIHALPLLVEGYTVTLIEPVGLHVEQARAAGVADAVVGDARHLQLADAVADAVMLLGPLYHLTEEGDRVEALAEARRVTRRDGILIAACISRFASTYDGLTLRYLDDPAFERIAEEDVRSGQHRNPGRRSGWFTTAYFHRPEDVVREVTDAGWSDVSLMAVEGPGAFGEPDFWLDGSDRQATLLRAIRRVESEPSILGASPHLLAVASNR
jgi:ubiquinone/menaquinone biosynthesis C-methylase UbiE